MATRFYLPSSGTAPFTPDHSASSPDNGYWWNGGVDQCVTLPMDVNKTNTSSTEKVHARTGANPSWHLYAEFVSYPLAAGVTFSTSITWAHSICMREGNASANAYASVWIRIWDTSADEWLDGGSANDWMWWSGEGAELTTTSHSQYKSAVCSKQLIAAAGDYIVACIGFEKDSTSSYDIGMYFGDNSATDLAGSAGDTDTSDNPWIETSANLTFTYPSTVKNLMLMGVGT